MRKSLEEFLTIIWYEIPTDKYLEAQSKSLERFWRINGVILRYPSEGISCTIPQRNLGGISEGVLVEIWSNPWRDCPSVIPEDIFAWIPEEIFWMSCQVTWEPLIAKPANNENKSKGRMPHFDQCNPKCKYTNMRHSSTATAHTVCTLGRQNRSPCKDKLLLQLSL